MLNWSPGHTQVVQLTGGRTNAVYKLTHHIHPSVIVRIFGSENLVSADARSSETMLVARLGSAGHAPNVQAVFANGRVEAFLEGRRLMLDEVTDDNVMRSVAIKLARLHSFRPSELIGESMLQKGLREWREDVAGFALQGILPMAMVTRAERALEEWQRRFEKHEKLVAGHGIVFAHNDVISSNLIMDEDGDVSLIDFEYAGWNFRGFEIANFFTEACGGLEMECIRPELYPSREVRKRFCQLYLNKSEGTEVSDEQVEELMEEVELFDAFANLMWGFWAMVKCGAEDGEETLLSYAKQRLHACYGRHSWA